jgi:quercetin dioxygenase-like cupin family protein
MGTVHKFTGTGGVFQWEGVEECGYESPDVQGVTVRWLIGPSEEAPFFAVRYFEVQPEGATSMDRHEHDHGVVIVRGRGQVRLGEDVTDVSFGDVVYVAPYETHQFKCVGREPLGFLCVVPARRSDAQ